MKKTIYILFMFFLSLSAFAEENTHELGFGNFNVEFKSNDDKVEYKQKEFFGAIFSTENSYNGINKKVGVSLVSSKKYRSYYGKLLQNACLKTYSVNEIEFPNIINSHESDTVIYQGVHSANEKTIKQEHFLIVFKTRLDEETYLFVSEEINVPRLLNEKGLNKIIEMAKFDLMKILGNIKLKNVTNELQESNE